MGQVLGEHQIPHLERIEVAMDPLVQIDAATPAAGMEVRQRPVEPLSGLQRRDIEVDLRLPLALQVVGQVLQLFHLLAELTGPLEEDLPRRRQHRLASPHLQQGQPQALLQLGDRMIEGGLALVQRLCGLGVTATVHHGLEDPPLLKRALGTKHSATCQGPMGFNRARLAPPFTLTPSG
ncbi:hypothetical protein D3C80_1397900 [compost metagenome]